jgi:hypothetical protein
MRISTPCAVSVSTLHRHPVRTTIGSRDPAASAQVGLTCKTASLYWRNTGSANGSQYCRIASRRELSEADLHKGLQWHRCARPTGRARIGTSITNWEITGEGIALGLRIGRGLERGSEELRSFDLRDVAPSLRVGWGLKPEVDRVTPRVHAGGCVRLLRVRRGLEHRLPWSTGR